MGPISLRGSFPINSSPTSVAIVHLIQEAIVVAAILIAIVILVRVWQHRANRDATSAVTSSNEYRHLSEMSVTTQEHTDLKLGEINMQIAQLRNQLEAVQKILKDIE